MYTGEITKIGEIQTGGNYEVTYRIYNDDKSNHWDETGNFNESEYPDVKSVQDYIRKRMKFYEDANSLITNLKKEIGVEIRPAGVTP